MSPDPSSPQEGSRHTPAQRRVLTAVTGTAVAVVAAGSFAVTYDALRDLAVAGRVGERWAPVYPVMADVLLVVVVLALLVARHAPWWSRALRWLVLVALFAGGAALSVQHAVWGFASLPQDRLRAGVAVAPHAALVLAVWLWLTMIRHLRLPRPSGRIRPTPVEGAHVRIVERAEPERPPASPPPASLPTDVELVRDGHAPDAPEAPETSADHDADHNADDDTDELVPVTSATRPDLVPLPPTRASRRRRRRRRTTTMTTFRRWTVPRIPTGATPTTAGAAVTAAVPATPRTICRSGTGTRRRSRCAAPRRRPATDRAAGALRRGRRPGRWRSRPGPRPGRSGRGRRSWCRRP
ncbi:hypothetical protein GCM10009678_62960 [Actinomadura kijaniata]|uniref:DUF2637 domain-containing protein n=1 Tax=Actinomadura kijaniata TaxID=46161 RepID=UPI002FEA588A